MDKLLLYKALKNKSGAEISASGNPAIMSDTLKNNPMNEMKVYGWSKQESTTGKNLFDFSRLVSDGVNVMDYEKKTITIPAKTNNTGYNQTLRDLCPGITPGTYVLSMKYSNPESFSGSYFLEIAKDFPVNTPIELTDALLDNHIAWYNNPDSEIENVISEIQLEAGDTATAYEPYTGGKPSPSPEYPQEIISAGMKWSTGAQLYDMDTRLNVDGIEYEKNGTSYTVNIVKISGNLLYGVPFQFSKEDVDATLSVSQFSNLEQANVRINLMDLEDNVVGTLLAKNTEKEVSAKCSKIRFNWSKGGKFIVSDLMLNYGGVALPYEPYTDGVPKLYGDKINLEVHGKNLFNLEYALNQKNWSGPSGYWYIPYYVGKGNTVSVTYGAEIPAGLRAYICINLYPGQTNNALVWLYHSVGGNLINNKCTFIAEADYIYINASGDYLSVIKKYMADLQIEVSPSPTTYEPYHEPQSLSIQTPTGLPAIPVDTGGNYTDTNGQQWIADYVDLKRGKYVQMVQTAKVPNDANWSMQTQSSGYKIGYRKIFADGISTQEYGMKKTWKSNMGESKDTWSNKFSFGKSNVFWIIPYENEGDLTSDDINAWLTEHPMDIMYPLATPIEYDLTQDEIQAYKNLVTYAGTTIVENDADCYMEVSAGGGDTLRAKKLALILGD